MSDEYLWPARNVAEFAYCPRLFYLMEVEGVYLPSADTEQGKLVHRRVHHPGSIPEKDDSESDRVVRSLALTSQKLGLTATMDLAEISGNTAVPIEYRKGRPRKVTMAPPPENPDEPPNLDVMPLYSYEAWPTDRVQLAFHAILLKEAGYEVERAILYYASEKRRLEIDVNDAFISEALITLEAAKSCAQGPRPMPLLNDARCLRCSLQPICLPDEVNNQRALEETVEMKPRKIWPPRDDGIHVVAQSNGARIGIRGKTMKVTDKDGLTIKEVPLLTMESLSVLGSVQISTQALHALADRCIPIAYLSSAGRMVAMVDPLDSVSAEIRKAQIRKLDDTKVCIELSRALVAAKILNQRSLLMRNHGQLSKDVLAGMKRNVEQVQGANSIDSIRGYEGQAAAVYFQHFAGMFNGQSALEFSANGRQRRPPPDPINACLSFAYTMLTHECVAALRLARLEPSIGAYHVSRPGRPALALDLMEPFRPLVGDSVAISAFNRGELTEGHFMKSSAGCALTNSGRKAFFKAYARRMDTQITHTVFGYRLSYRRMLVLHARMIAAWLIGEVPTLAFLTTR